MDTSVIATIIGVAVAAGGGFAALVRYVVNTWREDRKEERADRKAERDEQRADRREDREATKAVAGAMATMAAKFDEHGRTLGKMSDDFEEITGVHSTNPTKKKPARVKTEPFGVRARIDGDR